MCVEKHSKCAHRKRYSRLACHDRISTVIPAPIVYNSQSIANKAHGRRHRPSLKVNHISPPFWPTPVNPPPALLQLHAARSADEHEAWCGLEELRGQLVLRPSQLHLGAQGGALGRGLDRARLTC